MPVRYNGQYLYGVLKMWNIKHGYGFISMDDGGADVYVHGSLVSVAGNDFHAILPGTSVVCAYCYTHGKHNARSVALTSGAMVCVATTHTHTTICFSHSTCTHTHNNMLCTLNMHTHKHAHTQTCSHTNMRTHKHAHTQTTCTHTMHRQAFSLVPNFKCICGRVGVICTDSQSQVQGPQHTHHTSASAQSPQRASCRR